VNLGAISTATPSTGNVLTATHTTATGEEVTRTANFEIRLVPRVPARIAVVRSTAAPTVLASESFTLNQWAFEFMEARVLDQFGALYVDPVTPTATSPLLSSLTFTWNTTNPMVSAMTIGGNQVFSVADGLWSVPGEYSHLTATATWPGSGSVASRTIHTVDGSTPPAPAPAVITIVAGFSPMMEMLELDDIFFDLEELEELEESERVATEIRITPEELTLAHMSFDFIDAEVVDQYGNVMAGSFEFDWEVDLVGEFPIVNGEDFGETSARALIAALEDSAPGMTATVTVTLRDNPDVTGTLEVSVASENAGTVFEDIPLFSDEELLEVEVIEIEEVEVFEGLLEVLEEFTWFVIDMIANEEEFEELEELQDIA
jgi:hypothetical protein